MRPRFSSQCDEVFFSPGVITLLVTGAGLGLMRLAEALVTASLVAVGAAATAGVAVLAGTTAGVAAAGAAVCVATCWSELAVAAALVGVAVPLLLLLARSFLRALAAGFMSAALATPLAALAPFSISPLLAAL